MGRYVKSHSSALWAIATLFLTLSTLLGLSTCFPTSNLDRPWLSTGPRGRKPPAPHPACPRRSQRLFGPPSEATARPAGRKAGFKRCPDHSPHSRQFDSYGNIGASPALSHTRCLVSTQLDPDRHVALVGPCHVSCGATAFCLLRGAEYHIISARGIVCAYGTAAQGCLSGGSRRLVQADDEISEILEDVSFDFLAVHEWPLAKQLGNRGGHRRVHEACVGYAGPHP